MNIYNSKEVLRTLLEKKHMTVVELARNTGMHENTIYNWTAKNAQPNWFNMLTALEGIGYKVIIEDMERDDASE